MKSEWTEYLSLHPGFIQSFCLITDHPLSLSQTASAVSKPLQLTEELYSRSILENLSWCSFRHHQWTAGSVLHITNCHSGWQATCRAPRLTGFWIGQIYSQAPRLALPETSQLDLIVRHAINLETNEAGSVNASICHPGVYFYIVAACG